MIGGRGIPAWNTAILLSLRNLWKFEARSSYDGAVVNLHILQYEQTIRDAARAPSLREIVKQRFRCHRQSFGKLHDVLKRDIAFAALYSADVITVEACSLSELLLGQASLNAERADRGAEARFDRKRGHLSSCRDDHHESTHDECYLCLHDDHRDRNGRHQSTVCHVAKSALSMRN